MAWEKRKRGGRYYYRSIKVGGRVRKEYYGKGPAGELAASLDAAARHERQRQSAIRIRARQLYEAALEPLVALDNFASALLTAHLDALGYHYINGRWRRRHAK